MSKDLCGIYIGPDELRAVVLRRPRGGGFALAATAAHDLAPEEREEPGPALRAALKRVKVLPEEATVCLSKEQVTLIHGTLPSVEPNEVAEMARFEAERQIPFNAERHSIGHQVLRVVGPVSETLMAAADGPLVERALGALREAGLRPDGLNVSSACLVNALLYALPEVARTKTVALVSIGVNTLDLVFSSEGRILFSRSVPLGLRSLSKEWSGDDRHLATAAKMIDMMDLDQRYGEDAPAAAAAAPAAPVAHVPHVRTPDTHPEAARQWANRLIQEIRLSYDYARREKSCPAVDLIAIVGEGAAVRRLDRYLYVNLNVECVALNPVGSLPGAAEAGLPFGGHEMTVAFGAAIQRAVEGGYTLDLTPRAYYQALRRKSLLRKAAIIGAMVVFTGALGAAAWMDYSDARKTVAVKYDEINHDLRPVAQALGEQESQLKVLETYFGDPGNALAALSHVTAYPEAPAKVSIKSISFEKGVQTIVEGHAMEIPDINNFANYLRTAPFFEDVQVIEQPKRRALPKRDEVYVFRLQCRLKEYKPKLEREKISPERIRELAARVEKAGKSKSGEGGSEESIGPPSPGGTDPGALETQPGAGAPPAAAIGAAAGFAAAAKKGAAPAPATPGGAPGSPAAGVRPPPRGKAPASPAGVGVGRPKAGVRPGAPPSPAGKPPKLGALPRAADAQAPAQPPPAEPGDAAEPTTEPAPEGAADPAPESEHEPAAPVETEAQP